MPRITDPTVTEEARRVLAIKRGDTPGRTARTPKAMIAHYPALAETHAAANAAFDELLEREDVEFHLAYIANLEATFTPLFKMVFDNRRPLFEGGDERVGTLLLWHFAEEIEHRSSALLIHHHVTPDRWYRIRNARKVFDHVARIYKLILADFEKHVPMEARLISAKAHVTARPLHLGKSPTASRSVGPTVINRQCCIMSRDVICERCSGEAKAQTPHHDPAGEPLPSWVPGLETRHTTPCRRRDIRGRSAVSRRTTHRVGSSLSSCRASSRSRRRSERLRAGDVLLADDGGTKGHISRDVGDDPLMLMAIGIDRGTSNDKQVTV